MGKQTLNCYRIVNYTGRKEIFLWPREEICGILSKGKAV